LGAPRNLVRRAPKAGRQHGRAIQARA